MVLTQVFQIECNYCLRHKCYTVDAQLIAGLIIFKTYIELVAKKIT